MTSISMFGIFLSAIFVLISDARPMEPESKAIGMSPQEFGKSQWDPSLEIDPPIAPQAAAPSAAEKRAATVIRSGNASPRLAHLNGGLGRVRVLKPNQQKMPRLGGGDNRDVTCQFSPAKCFMGMISR